MAVEFSPRRCCWDLRFERTPPRPPKETRTTWPSVASGRPGARCGTRRTSKATVVLAHLERERGCHAPALFIHDFPARRLDNLRQR
ncbi:MAG: hypothetical protein IPG81_33440 [Sandaracinaceae bacterium]|nr:hypothetical protein [Sandaracinaceae bacterium]